jgi:alpha-mannosidase
MKFHLIGNSHIDPVWAWDWREGYNEALTTARTILDLMDENQKVTYIRGESSFYRHIEETDPATFKRIVAYVKSGRWDVVGGTYCQPDDNLTGIETLARQFTEGLRYFKSRFGRRVTAAWQPDSFGHTAGYPELLKAAGIDSLAFTRPDEKAFPLSSPAFWWEGAAGSRILAYRPMVGWYGTEKDEVPRRLDGLLEAAKKHSLGNVGCFYGLGDHGGGPTRRQLEQISTWMQNHPEIEPVHTGLHQFFAALRREVEKKGEDSIPVIRGEVNFCLRGCYASLAQFKVLYRRSENMLGRAEKTDSIIAGSLGLAGSDLSAAWREVMFNSFHDTLCGTCMERAYDDQTASLGEVIHTSLKTEFRALNRLAMQVDTRVADRPLHHPSAQAALIWNPHPQPFSGRVEVEVCLDNRPLWDYENRPKDVPVRVLGSSGKALPFQEIKIENRCMIQLPWRKRVLVPVNLPAFGWNVVEVGWVEGAKIPPVKNPVKSGPGWIDNGEYRVEAVKGKPGIQIFHQGKSLLQGDGLGAELFEDPWGSWGTMTEEPEGIFLKKSIETWKITEVELLESGTERALLWVRIAGQKSRIDLELSVDRDRSAVDVRARVFWAERSARLKLRFPVKSEAKFEVPGAVVARKPCGEVPGGKWVQVHPKLGLASNGLYNFDAQEDVFSATVVRGTRYCDDVFTPAESQPWLPATDLGEVKFRFLITCQIKELPRLARELEQPPAVVLVPAKKGKLPRSGSIASLQPESLEVLALKRAASGKGFLLRVQGTASKTVEATFAWNGKLISLGQVKSGQIRSWLLTLSKDSWKASAVSLAEEPYATPALKKKGK